MLTPCSLRPSWKYLWELPVSLARATARSSLSLRSIWQSSDSKMICRLGKIGDSSTNKHVRTLSGAVNPNSKYFGLPIITSTTRIPGMLYPGPIVLSQNASNTCCFLPTSRHDNETEFSRIPSHFFSFGRETDSNQLGLRDSLVPHFCFPSRFKTLAPQLPCSSLLAENAVIWNPRGLLRTHG